MSTNIPSPEVLSGVPEIVGSRIKAIEKAVVALGESTQAMGIVIETRQPNSWSYEAYTNPAVNVAPSINTATTPPEVTVNFSPDRFRPAVDTALEHGDKTEEANRAINVEAEIDVLAKFRRQLDEVYNDQKAA
jgi:hypothetical protein